MSKLVLLYFVCFTSLGISQVPSNNLIGFWSFTNNAEESTGSGNDGNVFGATLTEDRCGNVNSAYFFNGTSDYILMSTDSLDVTDEISISCWFKKTNLGTDIAVSKFDNSNEDTGYNLQFNIEGSPQIRGRDRNNEFVESGNDKLSRADGEWHHAVGIIDGSIWKIYVDTILIGEYDSGHQNAFIGGARNPLTFGRRSFFSSALNNWNYYEGSLDDIAIYNSAISFEEVVQLFNSDCCFDNIQSAELSFEKCPENIINVNGVEYFDSGIYIQELQSMNGCDSLININIQEFQVADKTEIIVFCNAIGIEINNVFYFDSDSIVQEKVDQDGCTFNLTSILIAEDCDHCGGSSITHKRKLSILKISAEQIMIDYHYLNDMFRFFIPIRNLKEIVLITLQVELNNYISHVNILKLFESLDIKSSKQSEFLSFDILSKKLKLESDRKALQYYMENFREIVNNKKLLTIEF